MKRIFLLIGFLAAFAFSVTAQTEVQGEASADVEITVDKAHTNTGATLFTTVNVVACDGAGGIGCSGNEYVLIDPDDSFKTFIDEGAAAKTYFDLPSASAGLQYTFLVHEEVGIRITAAAGDVIRIGSNVTAAAGYVDSAGGGDSHPLLSLYAPDDSEWHGYYYDGAWTDGSFTAGTRSYKDYNGSTQGGGTGYFYLAGFYNFPAADANLTQASTTVTFMASDQLHQAHASAVLGGAGSVDTGVVGLRITGTSSTSGGVLTPSDSETILADITTGSLNQYLESVKKWVGTVTWELYVVSGSPATYSLDFNYGIAKYEDFANRDFTVAECECVGNAGANETGFDLTLFHHDDQNWTYSAAGFVPGGTVIVNLVTDMTGGGTTYNDIVSGEDFAYKRSGLTTVIEGSGLEGVVLRYYTTTNNAVEYVNCHIGAIL